MSLPLVWEFKKIDVAEIRLFLTKAQRFFNGGGKFALEGVVRFVWWKVKSVETGVVQVSYALLSCLTKHVTYQV